MPECVAIARGGDDAAARDRYSHEGERKADLDGAHLELELVLVLETRIKANVIRLGITAKKTKMGRILRADSSSNCG